MQGFSFGLLVDTGRDEGPVAGGTPRRDGEASWLTFGLRRIGQSLLRASRRDALGVAEGSSARVPGDRRSA